jgi:glycosyl-4,4'-diaponeurosporenoate acyltransferase
MTAFIWTANVLGWPVIQIGIARSMLNLPVERFKRDNWIMRERKWERSGSIYQNIFRVRRWKRLLPDGARWLGKTAQKDLLRAKLPHLQLLAETRRAELAHWYMLLCTPIFFLWNPPWACLVMVAYAVTTNFPCIVSQRFNRIRIRRSAVHRNSTLQSR